ncbi:MAG TPA: hypothetical protein VFC39_11215 [Acidobacteriaceae bacterium]|nr:hypothetical protein [Acidobacteriaceae bacterium]
MATIHISLDEAERNLHGLLAQLDENTCFLIENGSVPLALIQPPPPRNLSLRERINLLPKDSKAVMDDGFARDVQAGIDSHRAPLDRTLWD